MSSARLRLATTTSTENSGLLKHLLDPWRKQTGIEVHVIAVGTGQALGLGRRGDADIVLVHAREREDAFVEAGWGVDRRDVMWNDFVILGPAGDPARVKGLAPAAALQRIAAGQHAFVSRGDDSGTHIRERALWKRASVDPEGASYYLKAGQGMGRCLVIADEKRAYILSDRGTYLSFAERLDLSVLVEGAPVLRNPYGAILVNPARHPHVDHAAARGLLDFLCSPEGQARIASFRVGGRALFHPAGSE